MTASPPVTNINAKDRSREAMRRHRASRTPEQVEADREKARLAMQAKRAKDKATTNIAPASPITNIAADMSDEELMNASPHELIARHPTLSTGQRQSALAFKTFLPASIKEGL